MGSNLWDHGQGTQFGPMTPSETTAEWTRPQKKSLWKMIWASESWVNSKFKTRCIVHVKKLHFSMDWLGWENRNRRFPMKDGWFLYFFPQTNPLFCFKTSVYGDMPQPVWGHSEDFPATEGRCSIYSPTATLVLLTHLANDLGHQMIIPYIFPYIFPLLWWFIPEISSKYPHE